MEETGCVPSQAEIGRHFGYKSPNSTRQHLQLIAKKGYIDLIPGVARGIRLVKRLRLNGNEATVPLVGSIAAGVPILAEENIADWIELPKSLFPKPQGLFALRVIGESMVGAGILAGDIAVIRKQSQAENGDIAAVRLEDEATLKRVRFRRKMLILQAENPDFDDIELHSDSSIRPEIEGVLEGIIRKLR